MKDATSGRITTLVTYARRLVIGALLAYAVYSLVHELGGRSMRARLPARSGELTQMVNK